LLCAAYANHFHNSFHFDDFHTIQNNLYVRSLANVPLFFTDASTFSNLPTHQVYRPLLTTTLAIDYVRGGGNTQAFHVTTFAFYLLFLAVSYTLFLRLMGDRYWALTATAIYGLHPVCAETVNYIVQRAEILSTLGVVAGLSLYLWKPEWRKSGAYLLPVGLALLVKPPALVFPLLLAAAVFLGEGRGNLRATLRAALPSLAVCGLIALLLSRMTAATFHAGGTSAAMYRLTQGRVALHYFVSFFAPLDLTADSDWKPVAGLSDPAAVIGLLFLAALGSAIWLAARKEETKPIAFGLVWFAVTLFPTSWMPLAEVANDHRMFFPFLGLTLAVVQGLRLALHNRPALRTACTAALCIVAAMEAHATSLRNEIWRNEETLWRDVTEKSPGNGRGKMNYGLTLMARGDMKEALRYFEEAMVLLPAYFVLEINLGVAKGHLKRDREAEAHFRRSVELEPQRYEPRYFYARWLNERGRQEESYVHAEQAVRFNPNALDARYLLMSLYKARGSAQELRILAEDTRRMVPGDAVAGTYLEGTSAVTAPTAEGHLARSLGFYNAGKFEESLRAAREALQLRPDYAEAFNNIAAASNALQRWDDGIRAAEEALRINPSFALARNNRQWALSQKQSKAAPVRVAEVRP